MERVEDYTFSATTLLAPNGAQGALAKGEEALQKREAHAAQGNSSEARLACEQALKADAKFINPYPRLAQMALNEKRWDGLAL
jgi:hypothetical protein